MDVPRPSWGETKNGGRFLFHERGFSLFEILIAIGVFAVVGVSVSQLIGVALQSDKTAGQKTVAVNLAQETASAVNAIAAEQWNNLYGLSGNRYPANTVAACGSVKWCVQSGIESLPPIDGLTYKRSFTVSNVSRASGVIENTYNSANDDPSTQKIVVTITWENSTGLQLGSISFTHFITRSRNAVATQTDWTYQVSTAPTSGENGSFGTDFTSMDETTMSTTTPSGSITLKQQ